MKIHGAGQFPRVLFFNTEGKEGKTHTDLTVEKRAGEIAIKGISDNFDV